MRRWLLSLACAVFVLVDACPARTADIDLGKITETQVMIPMRDGVRLSAYIYTPPGDGPWPVVFEQRYADLKGADTRKSFARMAEHGYVVCGVNFRGAQQSEGTWVGYRALAWGEKKDGYDLCEWLATQPWSNGKVGTFGSSQAGFAQNFLAVTQPPHLVCQYMIDTGLSLYHEGYRIGGTTRPIRFKGMGAVCRVPEHNDALMAEWFQHPTYDEYWAAEDCNPHIGKMNVPCCTIGSWYDFMCVGSIDSFVGRQHQGGEKSRGKQQLLIGPWLHGRFNKGNVVAEMKYPENANFDILTHMMRYFDHHLKGQDNGVDRDEPVKYYVMGALGEKDAPGNVWRTAKDWPIAAKETSYYVLGGGKLSNAKPGNAPAAALSASGADPTATTYEADPGNPAKIPAGGFPGAKDARGFEEQKNVLTFTTDVLKDPVEWTGRVKAELFVTSTARDSDFIVRVSDVYPDGRSILIIDYIRRARYRDGFEKEMMLEPGKVEKVAFDVGNLSQIFNAGHRIRVTIASTGAPFFEVNPNTGEPLTIEFPKNAVTAKNSIQHNAKFASRVIAPVIVP